MGIIEAIVLGAIQGLTEFIPVSSSGHLVLAQALFGSASDHKFLEFIDIGTLLALIIFFRGRIAAIIRSIVKDRDYRLLRNVILTSLPAGIIGLALSGFINRSPFFGSVVVVITALAVVGAVMVLLERLPKASPVGSLSELSAGRALAIGGAQVFALIPGVSRSGSTIIAGRLGGLSSEKAAEYSFLASIPIISAVVLKLFVGHDDRAYFTAHMSTLIISNLAAFVFGMLAIGFLLRYLARHDLKVFGWYRIIIAVVVSLLVITNVLKV